jgi:hypothetical protein
MNEDLHKLRFPIGEFEMQKPFGATERAAAIEAIEATPRNLRQAVAGLTEPQLDTPYRPDGWTVRQVVHHLPDSHVNSYMRFKLTITEDEPTIRTYHEDRWAELPDACSAPVETSLALLDTLHDRWVRFLRAIPDEQFARRLNHPEIGIIDLDTLVALYGWHGPHHVAHISALRERNGW